MTPRIRSYEALLAFAGALFVSALFPVARANASSFTVLDEKAVEELSEITRLYIDGRLVADVRLNDTTTRARIPVTVADRPGQDGRSHDYALCGEIVFRGADGSRQVHRVSGQGSLPDPDGHTFLALGARDFTLFYLADPSDRMAVRPQAGPSPFCQAPIS